MLTKEQHIAYWIETSEDDLETMQALFNSGRYTHSLFFGHLYLEKICKALWVRFNEGNTPPFIHNLVKILPKIDLGLTDNDFTFLDKLEEYQLKGRYPDYAKNLKQQTTKEYTEYCINYILKISECLRIKI